MNLEDFLAWRPKCLSRLNIRILWLANIWGFLEIGLSGFIYIDV